MLSISGIQKVDQIINEIKTKILESLCLLLGYVFDTMNNEQKNSIPYVNKMKAVVPILIKDAYLFATNEQMISMQED